MLKIDENTKQYNRVEFRFVIAQLTGKKVVACLSLPTKAAGEALEVTGKLDGLLPNNELSINGVVYKLAWIGSLTVGKKEYCQA